MGKVLEQSAIDRKRRTYLINFPADLDFDPVVAWNRSLSGTLRTRGFFNFFAQPSIVLEVWATNEGITHWLKIPYQFEPMVRPRLESLVPGIRLTPAEEHPVRVWVHAIEAGLKTPERQLHLYGDPASLAHSVLTNFSALNDGESLAMQWVIGPAEMEHKPEFGGNSSSPPSLMSYVFGSPSATKDEIADRRAKLDEPGMMAVLRVGAVAATKVRAQFMIRGLMSSLDSARGPSTRFYKRMVSAKELQRRIDGAETPVAFPIKLSAPEMAAVVGWPIASPAVAGLPAAVSRYLPAPVSVPSTGRVIGISTFPGRERKIAVSFMEARRHTHILGGTGAGKTSLMASMARQDMEAGFGLVLIESKGDLFKQLLDYVPPERMNDVVLFDINDVQRPVGYNVLEQSHPDKVVDELINLFKAMYRDHPSLWTDQVMYYGLRTLMLDPANTFIDLPALIVPTKEDVDWRDALIAKAKDPQLSRFWQDMENKGAAGRDKKAEPLLTRMWPLSHTKLMNIIGQSKSTFLMDDIVRENKILLVNLSGVEQGSAQLMGTLLMNNLWNSVKTVRSAKGLFLYLDEFHHYMNIPVDIEQMLVESRSMGLGMVFAHQYLGQLTAPNMAAAIAANAKTKITFQVDGSDARDMANLYGQSISQEDLKHLAQFEAVARVSTGDGVSPPLTLRTMPPSRPTGNAHQITWESRGRYGRPVDQVEQQILNRHQAPKGAGRRRRISDDPLADFS